MLEDKIVLVAGASGAIGSAVARECLHQGATVLLGYCRNMDGVAEIVEEAGGKAKSVQLDLAWPESLHEGMQRNRELFADIYGFVNCSGIHVAQPFISLSPEEINRQIAVNLLGAIHLTQIVCRRMVKKRRGSIVHLGSVAAHRMVRGHCVYSATKAGLEGFVKALAAEVARRGVRVNCILPGPVMSKMLKKTTDFTGDEPEKRIPIQRLIDAEEVAQLAAFLLSDRASAITGTVMPVDGGYMLL